MERNAARQPDLDERRVADVAIRYAEYGWPVVPLHSPQGAGCSCGERTCGSPGKHPRTRRGLHEASTDLDQIRAWWQRWPDANIGVTTGAASGLLVLDVDLPDGPASLAQLQAEHGPLPPTCEQRTGSGGRQLLFRHPRGTVGNRARLLPGIDVRGDGGYIVVPPSHHITGHRYRWTGQRPTAEPPAWLLTILQRTRIPDDPVLKQTARSLPVGTREQRYAAAAMEHELARLAAAVEGTRNDTLNRAAFNLGQLVAGGLLARDPVFDELERIAAGIGLGAGEIRRTIASGLAAGAQQPRVAPAPEAPSLRQHDLSPAAPVRHIGARRR